MSTTIVSTDAITVSSGTAGTVGPFNATGSNNMPYSLTAIGGSSGTVQLQQVLPNGTAQNIGSAVSSPGTANYTLQPAHYQLVLGGTTAPTNVALYRDGTSGSLEFTTQAAANAQAAAINAALQTGDTNTFTVLKADLAGNLWYANRGTKLAQVQPFSPVSTRTLQE
jgi:hypothetical protein